MVGINFNRNKISKQRIDLLRENEVILDLIEVDVAGTSKGSDAYFIKSDV